MATIALTFDARCDDVVSLDDDNIVQSAPTGYVCPRHIDGGWRVQLGVPPLSAEPGGSVDSSLRGDDSRSHRHGEGGVY